jgi:HSP20 family molecular chaperone IbpA
MAIEVTPEGCVLNIQAKRESAGTDIQAGWQHYERVRGIFLRGFTVPDTASC